MEMKLANFNESEGDSDESGSEKDSECGKYLFWYLSGFLHSSNVSEFVSKNHYTAKGELDVLGKFYLAFTSSYYKIKLYIMQRLPLWVI